MIYSCYLHGSDTSSYWKEGLHWYKHWSQWEMIAYTGWDGSKNLHHDLAWSDKCQENSPGSRKITILPSDRMLISPHCFRLDCLPACRMYLGLLNLTVEICQSHIHIKKREEGDIIEWMGKHCFVFIVVFTAHGFLHFSRLKSVCVCLCLVTDILSIHHLIVLDGQGMILLCQFTTDPDVL